MTEEVKQDETQKIDVVALPVSTREERATALVATIEHAMAHNAPLPVGTVKELRELLGIAQSPVSDQEVSESAWSDEQKPIGD